MVVPERFVCVTSRTWFALSSPSRQSNTVASSGMFALVSGVYPPRRTSRILSPSFVWAKPISSVPRHATDASAADNAPQSTPNAPRPRRGCSPTWIVPAATSEKAPLDESGRASSFQP